MKSCIEWRKGFKYLAEIDEFNIDFRDKKEQLIKFLDLYAISQRVNIRVPIDVTESEIELVIELAKKYNIVICFDWFSEEDRPTIVRKVKESLTPFYFMYNVRTWEDLIGYVKLGVKSVFISGELCFDLEKVRRFADLNNLQIRCYANICYNNWENGAITDFFIRPEDVDFYSQYIDVIEFYDSVDKQNVLYSIYFRSKEWNGNLQEIIKGLKVKVNNYYLMDDEFARRRAKCEKECIKGGRCQLCFRLIELAESLENSKDYEVFIRRDING